MATTRLVVALALACTIDASVETERVDALGSGELAQCVAEAKKASPMMQRLKAHPCPLNWAGRPCGKLSMAERMGAGHCEAYVDNVTGAVHSYGDSKDMCGVAAGAIELGIIAQPTRLAKTFLIDVGAAWSGEVIVGHKMGFQVAAFEARESEYKNIVRATRRFPGVDVVHAAVTDKAGPVEFHMSADSSSLLDSAVHGRAEQGKTAMENNRVVTVQGIVLDEYVQMHDVRRVAFLMLDVQGVEYNVLKGSINTLKEQKPVVMFEYDKRLGGPSADKVLCLLQSLGYECAFLAGDNAVCVPDTRARYLRGSRA